MKKLVLAIAASACAMSAYAADPKPIDFNVQLAGKVPVPNVFDVKPNGWDGSNVALDVPHNWDWNNGTPVGITEVQWSVKSTYGPVHIRLESSLQGKEVSENRGVLVHQSGDDFVELDGNVTLSRGSGWRAWGWMNNQDGVEVLTAEAAATGDDWVGVRLRVLAPGRTPLSGTYKGTMTATFETGIES
ncbi:hypothetical protein LGM42_23795 [Burkholderia sp. AU39826]|uniref:hypothetical protein n=1 Tax=Burkholderia sp. AU39826 TaxID=2879634 RepID=UPI001CF13027|nr:hypothetical protein [Burkholderia sp. AU39826]MCA7972901.1 hypothetical protein [Burkholderia sp. AU39826]